MKNSLEYRAGLWWEQLINKRSTPRVIHNLASMLYVEATHPDMLWEALHTGLQRMVQNEKGEKPC